MGKLFYDHLLIIEEIEIELDAIGTLTNAEKKDLLELVDTSLHHEILDEILTHLPRSHHHEFLSRFSDAPYDAGLLGFLHEKADINMEHHIFTRANKVKQKFLKQLKTKR